MAKYKVTHTNAVVNGAPEIIEAEDFLIRDGWVRFLDRNNVAVTTMLEHDVKRIDLQQS